MSELIRHYGSKKMILEEIYKLLPYHLAFVDVFGGSGSVIFNKKQSFYDIYNDLNDDFYNFFKVFRDKPQELYDYISRIYCFRRQFNEHLSVPFEEDVKRAGLFWFSKATSYLSKQEYFVINKFTSSKKNFNKIYTTFLQKAKRIVFEHLDYKDLIKKYDKDSTLFYLDPPYTGKKYAKLYGINEEGWSDNSEHKNLYNILSNIKGMFLLSYNYSEEIIQMYKGYNIKEIEYYSNLTVKNKNRNAYQGKKIKELLIWNY